MTVRRLFRWSWVTFGTSALLGILWRLQAHHYLHAEGQVSYVTGLITGAVIVVALVISFLAGVVAAIAFRGES